MTTLTEVSLPALEYIALNMRESDRVEIFNCLPYDSPLQQAWEAFGGIRNMGRGRIAWHDGKPAAVFAFIERWPGLWEVWMWGTDEFRNVAIDLMRYARKEANDILETYTGRRLQADVRESHPDAHRLIQAMGAVPEGPMMEAYGKDGSSYQRYVWIKGRNDAILKPGYRRAA